MINPLLTQFDLPPFSLISSKDIVGAVEVVVGYSYKVVEEILSKKNMNWENLCYPIQLIENQLQRIWSPIVHLYSVQNTVELRKAYRKSKVIIDDYEIWISQHRGLYVAYCNLLRSDHYVKFSMSQKKYVMNVLYKFKLSGIESSGYKRKQCTEVNKRLLELSNIYDENVLDATQSWKKLIVDRKKLLGLPEYDLDIARLEAIRLGEIGWLLTLKRSSYLSVMKYCEDRVLREEVYWAYNTRASEKGPHASRWDNTPIIQEILSLRYELSNVLGFNNYADSVLVKRMGKNSDNVLNFLEELSTSIYPHAVDSFVQLKQFINKYYGSINLYPWDMLFYIEKQRKDFFLLPDDELRFFFPIKKILQGMFMIANRLYGVSILERSKIDVWHADVRFFDIFDSCNRWLGGFYLDVFSRDYKSSGAWMDTFVSMMRGIYGNKQYPIAYLICNFSAVQNYDSLFLSHDEVSILFHEFGHVLHHIMTVVDIPDISGINGVVLDAVEVPSQFMEKFCWDPDILQIITSHYLTKKSLSRRLINQYLKYRRYEFTFSLLYQLIYSIFDIRVHCEYNVVNNVHFMKVFNDIKKKLLIFPMVDWDRFPHTFTHIFSSDYAAGYYSYLWSDVLASDIWFCFRQQRDILNFCMGQLFLDHILSRGGSEEFSNLFFRFRGQGFCTKFFLRYYYVI